MPPATVPPVPSSFNEYVTQPDNAIAVSDAEGDANVQHAVSAASGVVQAQRTTTRGYVSEAEQPPYSASVHPADQASPR